MGPELGQVSGPGGYGCGCGGGGGGGPVVGTPKSWVRVLPPPTVF